MTQQAITASADQTTRVSGVRVRQFNRLLQGGAKGYQDPVDVTFGVTRGDLVVATVSGSAHAPSSSRIGVEVLFNSAKVATCWVYTNEGGSHKAFAPTTVLWVADRDTLTVYFHQINPTLFDENDTIDMTVLEYLR